MTVHLVATERDFRGAGCSEDCQIVRAILPGVFGRSDLLLHDAAAHEAFGRRFSRGSEAGQGVIISGPLAVDTLAHVVTVGGQDVCLSPHEMRLLLVLVLAHGAVVEHNKLIREGMLSDWTGGDDRKNLRVVMSRLRSKLGVAGDLIVTSPAFGYRLAIIAPGETPPSRAPHPNRIEAWSIQSPQCRECGRTDRPHASRGLCGACRTRVTGRPSRRKRQP